MGKMLGKDLDDMVEDVCHRKQSKSKGGIMGLAERAT